MLFGTHPNQFNGYSKVVYNLTKRLELWRGADSGDLDLYVYGFQNFHTSPTHDRILQYAKIYDANFYETQKVQGFGFAQIDEIYESVKPHVCIIYNDMVVVINTLQRILEASKKTGWKSKVLIYTDQVYDCQKLHYINVLNTHVDGIIAFTESWKRCLMGQGVRDTLPMYVLPHGFDPKKIFPIPKSVARKYLGLPEEDFLVLNSNRNQPRKRWDICVMAFAEVIRRHLGEPIKLVVGTLASGDPAACAWDLIELFRFEFRRMEISEEAGLKHIVFTDRPQALSDEDITALYNATDIGINTCDGEGFGLCNFEQAVVGKPQIIPKIGGFRDVFDESYSILIEPKSRIYVDNSRDHVGGLAELCDPKDFADAIDKYYLDSKLRETHGEKAREHMLKTYDWDDVTRTYEKIIDLCLPVILPEEEPEPEPEPKPEQEQTSSLREHVIKLHEDEIIEKHSENTKNKKKKKKNTREKKSDQAEIDSLSKRLQVLLEKAEHDRKKKNKNKKKDDEVK